jgi:hypothetical protein
MGTLSSSLDRADIETLIEAMGDWEAIGNHEFHVLNMVKNAPIPPEDHEAHEFITNIKSHFKEREKDIKATREVRQEKAIFTKAKLALIKKDLGINELFDNAAAECEAEQRAGPVKKMTKQEKNALALAEEFIKDLGVQSHYEKFLAEKKAEAKEE